ncbi:MAG: TolC family protein [Nitrospinota bacterium]
MKTFKAAVFFLTILMATPSTAEQNVLELGEEESLLFTLQNNFEIRIQQTQPLLGEESIKLAESEFDPTLFAGIESSKSLTPSTSAFASPEVGESRVDELSLGVKQKLQTGASYELSLEASQIDTNSSFASLDPLYTPSLQLSLTQPLLKGIGSQINRTSIIVANNNRTMSNHQFAYKVMEVLTKTREAYWDLVYLNKELVVLQESLERAKDFLERIKLQVTVGSLAPIEIVAAQATVAVREETLIGVRHQISDTQDRLKALINKSDAQPGSDVRIHPGDEPVFKTTELGQEQLIELAYSNRPDYRSAWLDVENRERELVFNKNQMKPSLDLQGAIKLKGSRGNANPVSLGGAPVISSFDGGMADAFSDLSSGKYYDFSIGLVAEYPLFNRASKSRVATSQHELNASKTRFLSTKQAITMEVLRAIREIRTAEQTIHATKLSRILAEKKLEAESKKYDVGASTSFAVLEYQTDLAAEKSKEIKALIDYLKAIARLELATGTVLKKHNISLSPPA